MKSGDSIVADSLALGCGRARGAATANASTGTNVEALDFIQATACCGRKLLIFANTIITRGTPWTN